MLDNEEIKKQNRLEIEIRPYSLEADEFWSFVGSKKRQRWTWYAMERNTGVIVAWHNGRRTDESCRQLIKKMESLPIEKIYTDDWGSYSKAIAQEKHQVGKKNTQKIERKNLNFRMHLKRLERRTICYSRNEQIHDNVIGMYINRYYFTKGSGQFGK